MEAVSTTCGSGWVNRRNQYRNLIHDPPATAGGTDRLQVKAYRYEHSNKQQLNSFASNAGNSVVGENKNQQ